MKLLFRILVALWVASATLAVCVWAQTAPNYDALVRQGNTQLQAGNNDGALASANAAIKTDSDRWEAYALAGGALINLKRCDEAKADLNEAVQLAPEAKQPALRDLNGKCVASASGGGDASGPSYADTVRFIQDKIRLASYPTPSAQLNGVVRNRPGVAYKSVSDDAKYTFSADDCQSMTITATVNVHTVELSDDDHSFHAKDSQNVSSYTFPFQSVGTFSFAGQEVPAVFSTHDPKQYPLTGVYFADGYPIGGAANGQPPAGETFDVMLSQLPPTQAIERGTPDHQDWHDAVWIVPKDLGVSWSSGGESGNITKSGIPILMIRFMKPGTGGESTHVAKAIQHLVDLCVNHPDQSPKELF